MRFYRKIVNYPIATPSKCPNQGFSDPSDLSANHQIGVMPGLPLDFFKNEMADRSLFWTLVNETAEN